MRRALVLLAALGVAACQVEVEGAPCDVVGAADDCPPGQACGNDGRCSERAAACVDPALRCTPSARRCAGPGGKESVEVCSGELDPVCGAWVVQSCGDGLECGTAAGEPACQCVAFEGSEFAVDPRPPPNAVPFETGAASPPECRFRRLGDALAAAAAVGGPATVRAFGGAGEPVLFGDVATGETLPLLVPADVTLVGAALPAGPTVLRAEAATGADLLRLQGRLEAFRVETSAATGKGIAVSCGASGSPSLLDVAVDGGGSLARGIDVDGGTCGAALAGVDVANVVGPALRVAASAATTPVTVSASRLHASGAGIQVTGGKVTIGVEGDAASAVEVSDNAGPGGAGTSGEGILLSGGGAMEVWIFHALVAGNGGTGVVVENTSTSSKFTIRFSEFRSNGTISPRVYGPAMAQRSAGGLLVKPACPDCFAFGANRVYANGGDELVFESSQAFSIAPTSGCSADSNVFGCADPGDYAVSVVGGSVDATYTVWPSLPVDPWAGGSVTGTGLYCLGSPQDGAPSPPTCPAP